MNSYRKRFDEEGFGGVESKIRMSFEGKIVILSCTLGLSRRLMNNVEKLAGAGPA